MLQSVLTYIHALKDSDADIVPVHEPIEWSDLMNIEDILSDGIFSDIADQVISVIAFESGFLPQDLKDVDRCLQLYKQGSHPEDVEQVDKLSILLVMNPSMTLGSFIEMGKIIAEVQSSELEYMLSLLCEVINDMSDLSEAEQKENRITHEEFERLHDEYMSAILQMNDAQSVEIDQEERGRKEKRR